MFIEVTGVRSEKNKDGFETGKFYPYKMTLNSNFIYQIITCNAPERKINSMIVYRFPYGQGSLYVQETKEEIDSLLKTSKREKSDQAENGKAPYYVN
jgi:hypothetical protein